MKDQSPSRPPRWADRWLSCIIRKDLLEEIQGDLHESFYWRVEKKGVAYAKRHFIKEALLSSRMSNLKKPQFMKQFFSLFESHLKSGWRYLWKTKTYSSINIIGLSIGIVFSWFAYIYTVDQTNYNQHFKNVDNLYRLTTQVHVFDNTINLPGVSHSLTLQIREEIAEVVGLSRFTNDQSFIKVGDTEVREEYLMADKSLFDYLNLEFIEGTAGTFIAPDQAIISERMAYKLGIRGEAADHYLQILDSASYRSLKIAGVYKNIPSNSSVTADIILPYSYFLKDSPNDDARLSHSISTILEFSPTANPDAIHARISELMNSKTSQSKFIPLLQPIKNLHLAENYFASKGFQPGGNSRLIWFILIAGILCLSISIINYANFSISLYFTRTKEVAVRKILGSARRGVFQQLMTESFLTVLLSTVLAVGFFYLMAPVFSNFVEKQFTVADLFTLQFIPGIIAVLFFTTILSGLYPALLLSRLKILRSVKGISKTVKGRFVMQVFLIVQFSISIIMITCMLTFNKQLKYLSTFDLGYQTDNLIRLKIPAELVDNKLNAVLVNKLQDIPEIVRFSSVAGYGMTGYVDGNRNFSLMTCRIDTSFIDIMGLTLLQGTRLKDAKEAGVANGVIVNEAFLKKYPDMNDPIGRSIPYSYGDQESSVIVGVIKDYYHMGIRSDVSPLVLYNEDHLRGSISFLLETYADKFEIEEKLTRAWNSVYTPIPLSYNYVSQERERSLEQEAKISGIARLGGFIAIIIASFGLLGLVGLTLQRKLKEVCVRRILGARIENISTLMLKNFLAPILISLIIGLSVATYFSLEWLSNYTHRIPFEWTQLTIPSLLVIFILVAIIVAQVLRASNSNPAVHLRDE